MCKPDRKTIMTADRDAGGLYHFREIEMDKNLEKRPVTLKTGTETLSATGKTLLDFWRWNGSDLVSNTTRGRLAEFIVASAMNIDTSIPRDEWSAWDLTTPEGIRIEVKSAAYLQSWTQRDFSRIAFSIRSARPWDSSSGDMAETPQRTADIYVFCLLKHKNKDTLNPLNLAQWEFYVLSTGKLNNENHSGISITLTSLQKLTPGIVFEKLRETIISM
jgi:hypothetical protein